MVLDYLVSCLMIEQIDILFWRSCRYYLIVMIEQIDILFSLPFISSVSALKLLGFRFYYISGRVYVHSVEVPVQNCSLISVEVPLHWSLASYLLDIVTTTGIPPLMFFSCLFLVNLVWLAHYFLHLFQYRTFTHMQHKFLYELGALLGIQSTVSNHWPQPVAWLFCLSFTTGLLRERVLLALQCQCLGFGNARNVAR